MTKTTKWSEIRQGVVDRPGAEERLAELRKETLAEIGLFELRRKRDLSQKVLADRLGVSQPTISQLERAKDARLSTLNDYVEGLGGQLRIVAEFADEGVSYPLSIGADGQVGIDA
jgi:DNA-binding XRE family transcriptional regulator